MAPLLPGHFWSWGKINVDRDQRRAAGLTNVLNLYIPVLYGNTYRVWWILKGSGGSYRNLRKMLSNVVLDCDRRGGRWAGGGRRAEPARGRGLGPQRREPREDDAAGVALDVKFI